jgi:hypothetical protein
MTTRIWVAILFVSLLLAPITGWVCYEKGKTKGYALASKDRATQTYAAKEQTISNAFNYGASKTFALLSFGRFHLFAVDGPQGKPEVVQKIDAEKPKEPKK